MMVSDMNTLPVHRSVDTSSCLVEPSWLINQESPYDFAGNPQAMSSGRIGEIHSHDQLPGILVKLELELSFLIDDELRGRENNTVTLLLVSISFTLTSPAVKLKQFDWVLK